MKIRFRDAQKSDVRALRKIEKNSFSTDKYKSSRISLKAFREYVCSDDYRLVLAANQQDKVAGYVLVDVSKEDQSAANIDSLAVHSRFRESGVASGLLKQAFSVASEEGFPAITFEMHENNPVIPALLSTDWVGCSEDYRQKQYYDDGGTAIHFIKTFDGPLSDL